jgi:hypothetical protein
MSGKPQFQVAHARLQVPDLLLHVGQEGVTLLTTWTGSLGHEGVVGLRGFRARGAQETPERLHAFAAANMVTWLLYPTELGREPDQLEKMAVFTARKPDGDVALYVWRFRCGDGPWYAGVSGPYLRDGVPKLLHGDLTFSRFDEWSKATAERHSEAVLENLDGWRLAKA